MRLGVAGAVVNGAYVPGDVEVADGRVVACGRSPRGSGYALPGLVDLQVNGYGGVDFNNADAEGFEHALDVLLHAGVLAVQPTIITDHEDMVARQLRVLGTVQAAGRTGCRVVGVHAEGPFLSAYNRGVHRTDYLRAPDVTMVRRWVESGPLRTITVAPELDGALDLVRWASAAGLVVQAGHSSATAEQTREAFDNGARAVTHIFNGMVPLGHRMPGIVGATLAREDVSIQLIADNVHVSSEVARLVLSAAEHRTMLVTDSASAAGAPDGRYTVGGYEVTVVDGVPRLPDGTLAGSTTSLLQQVQYLHGTGWPLDRAVNLASLRPARFLDLSGVGVLRVGSTADLLTVDEALGLQRVLLAGRDVLDA